ncbi:hypothetical protein [Hwanghaeella sp.]|uniref:hypothetical protein n=1 Tax=Hwanghaeella sp. TaxID=2605943 RepID=UPI003CCBCAF8
MPDPSPFRLSGTGKRSTARDALRFKRQTGVDSALSGQQPRAPFFRTGGRSLVEVAATDGVLAAAGEFGVDIAEGLGRREAEEQAVLQARNEREARLAEAAYSASILNDHEVVMGKILEEVGTDIAAFDEKAQAAIDATVDGAEGLSQGEKLVLRAELDGTTHRIRNGLEDTVRTNLEAENNAQIMRRMDSVEREALVQARKLGAVHPDDTIEQILTSGEMLAARDTVFALIQERTDWTPQQKEMAQHNHVNALTTEAVKGAFEVELNKGLEHGQAFVDNFAADDPPEGFTPEDRDRLVGGMRNALKQAEAEQKRIVVAGLRRLAQSETDAIMASGMDEADALSAARRIADPDLRDDVVRRVTNRYAELGRLESDAAHNRKAQAVELAQAGRYEEIPAETLAELPPTMADTLAKMSERAIRGAPAISDPAMYVELSRMTPEQLKSVDLLDERYLQGLDTQDWQAFVDRQRSAYQSNAPGKAVEGRTRTQIFNATVKEFNFNDEEAALLGRRFDEEISAFNASNDRNPDALEMQEIVDRLTVEGAVPNAYLGFVDKDIRAFEAAPDEVFEVDDVEEVPTGFAEAFTRHHGRKPTDDELVDTYNAYLAKRRGVENDAK